jgi:hypothetical protein
MKIIWTAIATKSYYKNIEFLLTIWNLKIAQEFILEIENTMAIIKSNPTCFEKWEFDSMFYKGTIHKNVSFFYKVYKNEIVVYLFWNNLQSPKRKQLLNLK